MSFADQGIENLLIGMRNASAFYQKELMHSHNGRVGAGFALHITIQFLSGIPEFADSELLLPLRDLQRSLIDAERGNSSPLFTSTKVSHRPPDPIGWMGLKAIAAAAMEGLMRAGLSRRGAAAEIARKIGKRGYLTRNGKLASGRRVENCWDDCPSGNAN